MNWKTWKPHVESLEDRCTPAVSFVASATDSNVLFATDDQSMWAPGTGATISKNLDLNLIDTQVNAQTIGGFAGVTIGDDEILESGAKITVNDGNINAGIRTGVQINSGSVGVDYQADLSLQAQNAAGTTTLTSISPGDTFTIDTSQLAVDLATMVTDFPDFRASLGLFADIDFQLDVQAKLAGVDLFGPSTVFNIDTNGEQYFEILGLGIGQSSGIDVSLFNNTINFTTSEEGIDLPIPDPVGKVVGATVFIPELDTAPPTTSTFANGVITNTKLSSLEQANTGETDIDFLRTEFDLDAIASSLATGGASTDGFGKTSDLGKLGSLELFLLDAKLQGLFGLGQTFQFTPNLQVNLHFSQPTLVETSPGSGIFSLVTAKQITVGDKILAKHPGGDLKIDPTYTVANNKFANDTDIRFRPNVNLRFFGYNADGALGTVFDALNIPKGWEFAKVNLPGDAGANAVLKLGDVFNSSFSLSGFSDVNGSDLILAALEPPTLSLNTVNPIVENGTATLSGTITDVNAGDYSSLAIDWDGNGTTDETIQFPDPDSLNPAPLPSNVTWNPTTGAFTVTHQYLDNGTYTIKAEASDSTGQHSDVKQTTVVVSNAAPVVSLNALAAINENETATITGSFTDPGQLDTFSVIVNWADDNSTAASTFAVGRISTLSVNQTIHSSTDSAVLTVTGVNTGAGTATFSVQHQYLDDGVAPGNGTLSDVSKVKVTVTDDDNDSGSDQKSLTVKNVAPVITDLAISATQTDRAKVGDEVTLAGSFTDIGTLDHHRVQINWDDGTASDSATNVSEFDIFNGSGGGNGSFTINHSYDTEGGIYNVTVMVIDDDTGTAQASILGWVTGIRVNDGNLEIVGSSADDHVTINELGSGSFKVHADFLNNASFVAVSTEDVNNIIAYLGDGDDQMSVAGNIILPTIIHGEDGDDQLNAGGGPSVLLGEAGDDQLNGSSGGGFLVGGSGLDRLIGGSGGQVMIGGQLDQTEDNWIDLLNIWVSDDPYSDRVVALQPLLAVSDDGAHDELNGGSALDLFFNGLNDDLLSVESDEKVL